MLRCVRLIGVGAGRFDGINGNSRMRSRSYSSLRKAPSCSPLASIESSRSYTSGRGGVTYGSRPTEECDTAAGAIRGSRRFSRPLSKRASAGEGGNFRQDIDEAQRRHWKRVAAGQDYEVRYEAKKTGKSKGEVKRAVKRVGPSRKKVEKTLRRKK